MKNFCCFLIFLVAAGVLYSCSPQTNQPTQYEYQVYLPDDYRNNDLKPYPVIFFLHGASLRGNDLEKINKYGLPKLIKEGCDFDFIIISPQCPPEMTWTSEDWFLKIFVDVKQKYRVDTNRVYLTGMSLGGEGTWYIAEKFPDLFAAIAPVCGRTSHIRSILKDVDKIAHLPVWIFHGVKDKVYPVNESDVIYEKLKRSNAHARYTRYPDLGHGATHDSTYRNEELYRWFLEHTKH